MQSLQHFTEITNNFILLGLGRNNSAFWELFLFKSSAIFDNLQYIKTLRVRTYIDINSFLKNKLLRDIFFIEEFDVVKTNVKKFSSKKFEIYKADWTMYPYHLLYTKDKIVEFVGYFRNLYLDSVHKHFMTVTSNIIFKYIDFSIYLEKIVLSEIFSNSEWKTSTIIIRGKPCLSKLIVKEITDFDLYLKNFKYKPVNLNKFQMLNVLVNNIYLESSDLFKNSYNYFQTLPKFKSYYTHFLPFENINYNCKIWTKFYPENIISFDNSNFFIYFQDFNIYFKSIVTSSFDFTNNKLIFNKESDKFRNIISFSNVFIHPNIKTAYLGLFITYKTDSDLFKFLSTIFLFSIYDNSMLSEWFNSLYFNFAKDLVINNKSDFGILYKTIGGWNNYSELNLATNGKWFFESKIVDKKTMYDWKWKRNLNTFVPKTVYNVNHFDSEKKFSNFSEIKIKILPNSVSNKIDRKVLDEILISKELIKNNVSEVQNEALRTMWDDYRRYRTRRMWRHFPHHAAYVEKYFTDPKTRKK